MKTISAQEYHKIKDQIRTIDVRTEQEYKILVRFNWAEKFFCINNDILLVNFSS
jgi:ribosome biogenesis protein Tsr3